MVGLENGKIVRLLTVIIITRVVILIIVLTDRTQLAIKMVIMYDVVHAKSQDISLEIVNLNGHTQLNMGA